MDKVLFVSSEAVPFAKTGGLGEVAGSLPLYLRKQGVDVRVIMPKYGSIDPSLQQKMRLLKTYTTAVAWRNQYCGIFRLDYKGVPFYFIDNEFYFKRDGVYGYYDEAERFVYFCRAVLEGLPYLDFEPEILHCHDWQSGLVPLLLQTCYREDPDKQGIKTVFTIHNLKYQGIFTHWILHNILGLGDEFFTKDELEYHGEVNLMKAGIIHSDVLSTVSTSYAAEIKYPFFGEGLDGLVREKESKLIGILNGLDYEAYDPQTDPYIAVNYENDNPLAVVEQKKKNKVRLQKELGLPINERVPLLGIVSRLTAQKGLDLLVHILEELLSLELQLVILGTGEDKYEDILTDAARRHPVGMRVKLSFDEGLARRIYASSDIYLMPSLFEPCGLSQMIALRYGSLPVVRETGGLKDTVLSYSEVTGEGNGFSFTNYNADDFFFTIRRALSLYRKEEVWAKIVGNALNTDCSWENSARAYHMLYRKLKGQEGTP